MENLCFPILSPYYVNSIFPYFGNCMDFYFTKNIWETHNFWMFFFTHTFPLLWKFTFPIFWELYGFLLHSKYLRNPKIWNVCVFPYFSHTMEILFFCVLGTAWIPASSKKYKKPLTFKCLCFRLFFPYYGNSLFPYFGNCMDKCFKWNM